jgi:hypothetical protein
MTRTKEKRITMDELLSENRPGCQLTALAKAMASKGYPRSFINKTLNNRRDRWYYYISCFAKDVEDT